MSDSQYFDELFNNFPAPNQPSMDYSLTLSCIFSHRAAGRWRDMTPCTPPSSPCDEYTHTGVSSGDAANKNLVTINLILVDKTSPEFATVYNNVSNAVLHLVHISTVTFQLVMKI